MINKKMLFKTLTERIRLDLELALTAAKNTYADATHEDNKAENKYDTRSLEASYLAGAQAERAADIRLTLEIYENLPPREFGPESKIALTALVEVGLQGKSQWVLLMPRGGGVSLTFEGRQIQVITPESPLGRALIGHEAGDAVEIRTGDTRREYEIISIH